MDFGNPKELRFFNDLRPIPGSEAFGRGGGGGGHIVTDFVTRVMRPKYLLKKSDKHMFCCINSQYAETCSCHTFRVLCQFVQFCSG